MTQTESRQVKVLFRFYSNILDQDTVEILRAETIDLILGHYRIRSIPCYAEGVATNDLIQAEYDESEGMLTYREMLQSSGNSTVWVVITDESLDIEEVRDIFRELGCLSQEVSDRYFSMEVKASVNYLRIKDKLNELKADGLIDYAEPCLSAEHQY